jgi:hypothetical protein
MLLALLACPPTPESASVSPDSLHSAPDSKPDSKESIDSSVDSPVDSPTGDEDGDGYISLEAGGDDCDDHDPWTHPGAEEWCDPIDHDCNGEPLEPGVCAKVQLAEAIARPLVTIFSSQGGVASTENGGRATAIRLLEDITGDGMGDVLIASEYHEQESGAREDYYLLYPGGSIPTQAWMPLENFAHGWSTNQSLVGGLYQILASGDVSQDGQADLTLAGMRPDYYGLWTYNGPIATDGQITSLFDTELERYVGQADAWGTPNTSGDFDGDGRLDYAIKSDRSDNQDGVDLFFGGTYGTYIELNAGTPDMVSNIGDLDLDGVEDLMVVATQFGWISGSDLRFADGATLTDLAAGTWENPMLDDEVNGVGELNRHWGGVGDWDGDGYPEVAAASANATTTGEERGVIFLFGGDLRGDNHILEATHSIIGPEGGYDQFGEYVYTADVDLDGIIDVVAHDSNGTVKLVSGRNGLPALNTSVDEIASMTWLSNLSASVRSYESSITFGADVTGDGLRDWTLAVNESNWTFGLMLGWEIPYDDPQYW